jgi:ribA/ribD-fused uncharacterized protein
VDHGATQVAQGNFATSVAFDNPHFHSEHVSTDVGNDDNEHGHAYLADEIFEAGSARWLIDSGANIGVIRLLKMFFTHLRSKISISGVASTDEVMQGIMRIGLPGFERSGLPLKCAYVPGPGPNIIGQIPLEDYGYLFLGMGILGGFMVTPANKIVQLERDPQHNLYFLTLPYFSRRTTSACSLGGDDTLSHQQASLGDEYDLDFDDVSEEDSLESRGEQQNLKIISSSNITSEFISLMNCARDFEVPQRLSDAKNGMCPWQVDIASYYNNLSTEIFADDIVFRSHTDDVDELGNPILSTTWIFEVKDGGMHQDDGLYDADEENENDEYDDAYAVDTMPVDDEDDEDEYDDMPELLTDDEYGEEWENHDHLLEHQVTEERAEMYEMDEHPGKDDRISPERHLHMGSIQNLLDRDRRMCDDDDDDEDASAMGMNTRSITAEIFDPILEYWGNYKNWGYDIPTDDERTVGLLFERILKTASGVCQELLHDECKMSNWIHAYFPVGGLLNEDYICRSPDCLCREDEHREEFPETFVSIESRPAFLERVPHEWVDIHERIAALLLEKDYQLLEIFPSHDLRRINTFVANFSNIVKDDGVVVNCFRFSQDPDVYSESIDHLLARSRAMRDVLEIYRYALWPNDIETRTMHLIIDDVRDEMLPLWTHCDESPLITFDELPPAQGDEEDFAMSLEGQGAITMKEFHDRTGHQSLAACRRAIANGLAPPIKGPNGFASCSVCDAINIQRASKSVNLPKYLGFPIGAVFTFDIHGPLPVPDYFGNSYWIIFVEWKSERKWIYFLKLKSEAHLKIKDLIADVRKHDRTVRILYCDNAREFGGEQVEALCENNGIRIEHFATYTPNGNIAENANLDVEKHASAMMRNGNANLEAWSLAAANAVDISNDLIKAASRNPVLRHCTPNQLFETEKAVVDQAMRQMQEEPLKFNVSLLLQKMEKPNFQYRRVFWSRATLLDHHEGLGDIHPDGRKLDGEYRFVGTGSNGYPYKFFDLYTLKFRETVSARVNEDFSDIEDVLTGFRRTGGTANIENADLAQRIYDSWDTSNTQDLSILDDDDETSESEAGADDNDDDAIVVEKPEGPRRSPRITSSQKDHAGDIDLLNEAKAERLPQQTGFDDGELRTLRRNTERSRVKKGGHQSADSEHSDRVARSKKPPADDHKAFLRRIHRADTPVSYQMPNPKRRDSASWRLYENYKKARTLQEALKLGTSWSRIYDEYAKGYLRVNPEAELRRLNPVVQSIFRLEGFKLPGADDETTRVIEGHPVLFWRNTDPNFYLSNWYCCDFEIQGHTFNCAEQGLMFYKAELFRDFAARDAIMDNDNPRQQKELGRQVANFDQRRWDDNVERILYEVLYAKFHQNAQLGNRLLNTGCRPLAEASRNDCIYGIGVHINDDRAQDMQHWIGANLLGRTLQEVRHVLRQQIRPTNATMDTWRPLPSTDGANISILGVNGKDASFGANGRILRPLAPQDPPSSEEESSRSTMATMADGDQNGGLCFDAELGKSVRIPKVVDFLCDKPQPRVFSTHMIAGPEEPVIVELGQAHDDTHVIVPKSAVINIDITPDRFISREAFISAVAAQVEKLLDDVDARHKGLKSNTPDDSNIKDMCAAVDEGLSDIEAYQIERTIEEEMPPTPKSYEHAMALDPDQWLPSMINEITTLLEMRCWDLVRISDMRPEDNLTGSTWAFKIKSKQLGFRRKSRCCAQGFSQEFGLDYFETYSSVVTAETLRVAIALAAANRRILTSFDVKNAYINSLLPQTDRVFMKQPPGFAIEDISKEADQALLKWYTDIGMKVPQNLKPGEKLACRLRRALYGLKVSARLHHANMTAWFIEIGFIPLKSDDCVFVYRNDDEEMTPKDLKQGEVDSSQGMVESGSKMKIDCEVYMYVDDLMCSAADETSASWFSEVYKKKWDSSPDSGGLAYFLLGMDIVRCEETDGIIINQQAMISDIAKKFGATEGRAWSTPMASDFDPSFDEDEEVLDKTTHNFRSLIGAVLFVTTHSRPDVATATSMLCSAMAKPQMKHWRAGIRLVAYLYQTRTLGLSFTANINELLLNKIVAYVDASWAAEKGSRSRGGYCVKLNGAAVSYQSKLINSICLSTAEAETTAAVSCLKEVVWLRLLLFELGYAQPGSTEVFEDSMATIKAASNNSQTRASRYYQLRTAFIRQLIKSGTMHFTYVNTEEQTADVLSKNVPAELFIRHQSGLLGPQPESLPDK